MAQWGGAICRDCSLSGGFLLPLGREDTAEKMKTIDQMGCGGGCNLLLHKGVDLGE
jgi:hypothetical protein